MLCIAQTSDYKLYGAVGWYDLGSLPTSLDGALLTTEPLPPPPALVDAAGGGKEVEEGGGGIGLIKFGSSANAGLMISWMSAVHVEQSSASSCGTRVNSAVRYGTESCGEGGRWYQTWAGSATCQIYEIRVQGGNSQPPHLLRAPQSELTLERHNTSWRPRKGWSAAC